MTKFNPMARYSDDELRASYRAIDKERVKTGRNKGCVTMAALRREKRLLDEAKRCGAEYPALSR